MKPEEAAARAFLRSVTIVPCSEDDQVRADVLNDVWSDIAPKLAVPLAALLVARDAEVREESCRAICDQCAAGVPVELDTLTSGEWVHENGEGCLADAIRAGGAK